MRYITEENKPQGDSNGAPAAPPANPPADPANDRLSALEKQIGDLSTALSEQQKYNEGAALVISTIAGNEELTKAFRKEFAHQQGLPDQQPPQSQNPPNNPNPQPSKTAEDPKLQDMMISEREDKIRDFERDFGITNLKEEEKKEVRQKIEANLRSFGWSTKTMPLAALRDGLEKAYTIAHAEKLRQEGKLEGFAQARNVNSGVMGTFSGGAPSPQADAGKLTDKQVSWAKKLGVDPEKAQKTYQEQESESTRIAPTEKKS